MRAWSVTWFYAFVLLYVVATIATAFLSPGLSVGVPGYTFVS